MQETAHRRAFFGWVLVFFLVEIFSPFAYAQTPTPDVSATPIPSGTPAGQDLNPVSPAASGTPATAADEPQQIGICTISAFTPEEARRFLDAVYNFQGKELTDKSDSKLAASTPGSGNGTTVVTNVYNFPNEQSQYLMTAAEAAEILGRSTASVADELGVNESDYVTAAQVTSLAEKDSNKVGILEKLRNFKGGKTVSGPGFEDMKVTLPGGKEVPLGDIYKLKQIHNAKGDGQCMLDSARIKGGVSYLGLLDKDLLIGSGKWQSLNLSTDENTDNQSLTTNTIHASITGFNDNGGNLIIPNMYERAVGAMGKFMSWDILISGMLAVNSIFSKDLADFQAESTTKSLEASKMHADTLAMLGREREAVPLSDQGSYLKRAISKALADPSGSKTLELWPQGEDAMVEVIARRAATGEGQTALKRLASTYGLDEKVLLSAAESAEGEAALRTALKDKWSSISSIRDQQSFFSEFTLTGVEYETSKAGLLETIAGIEKDTTLSDAEKSAAMTRVNADIVALDNQRITPNDVERLETSGRVQGQIERLDQLNQKDIPKLKQFATFGAKRFWTNTFMAGLWLGPGRLGLELAGTIVMTSYSAAKDGQGSFLIIYADNGDVASAFRRGTDFLGLGRFLDAVSEHLPAGVPGKVYWVDSVLFLQNPEESERNKYSTTVLSRQESDWNLVTQWQGKSSATAFEDVKDGKAITSMALKTDNLQFSGQMHRKKEFGEYYRILEILGPLFAWKFLQAGSPALAPIATILQLQVLQLYIENIVDPSKFSADETCSQEKLDNYIRWYKRAVVATTAEQFVLFSDIPMSLSVKWMQGFVTFLKSSDSVKYYRRIANVADPLEMGKQHAAAMVFNYATTCKDPSYKVLAYQRIPQESKKSTTLKKIADKTTNPLAGIAKDLNIGEAFAGVGKSVTQAELKEVLNTKVLLEDQTGMVRPTELYYFHLDPESANMEWFNVYDDPSKFCFRQCLQQSDGSAICIDGEKGVYKQNPDGTRTYLADADHALSSIFIPGLGSVVPNKLISASLSCGPTPVMEASGSGTLRIVDASCPAMDCAVKALAEVSKKRVGADLTDVLGKVEFVSTTVGYGAPIDSEFRFTRKTGVRVTDQKSLLGIPLPGTDTEIKAEAQDVNGSGLLHKEESLVGTERRFSSIEVLGNGRARVAGGTEAEDDLGTLQTISFERGAIHYDATRGKLFIALRVLADVPARDITGISIAPSKTSDAKADYAALQKQLADLLAKIASGQKLSADELELLKSILSKPAPASASLTSKEKETYKEALAKQAAGKPLTPDEQAVVDKVAKAEKSPGIIILPPEKVERVEKIMRDQGVDSGTVDALRDKLRDGTALTKEEKDVVTKALDDAKKDGSVPESEADQLKKDVANATDKGDVVDEIVNALSGGKALTPEQKAVVDDAVKAEEDRAKAGADSGVGPGPAISLGGATAKPGSEESAVELNNALKGINPLTDFVTDKNIVSLRGPDAEHPASEFPNGYVRIGDRTTGTFQDLKATGAPQMSADGKSVVIPTEKGDVKVDLSVDKNGQPIITVNAPGVQDSSPLVFAQGPNGLLWFDKNTNTWKALNGMNIPADELFGKYGVTFNGGQDGTTGTASENRFSQNKVLDSTSSYNPLLALPSWPETPVAAGFILVVVLVGVAFVRARAGRQEGRGGRGKKTINSQSRQQNRVQGRGNK